ncbi:MULTISPECIES: hypothetical protein [Pseudoalteromonas]|uniref:hypothetical protein n=1 Tax=Pseudoalteromonas TaxID=53246 RepID=UPI000F782FE0|nr:MULTISPECIES: hypothetical protein [Pseudoalteromonas]MCG7560826.1 hypothetical protein [Pseudoalteromonas sp. McH1-42]MEC4090516.1 hypothetical protein [Pseudoalteromonas rubra]
MKEVKNYIPPLVALLIRAEELKEAELTETEVLKIKDSSTYVLVPEDVAVATAESRGYADIDSENVWEEWQKIRIEIFASDT